MRRGHVVAALLLTTLLTSCSLLGGGTVGNRFVEGEIHLDGPTHSEGVTQLKAAFAAVARVWRPSAPEATRGGPNGAVNRSGVTATT